MVWPLLLYAGGLALQTAGKDSTVNAQQHLVGAEADRQRAARAQSRRLIVAGGHRSAPLAMQGPESQAYNQAVGDAAGSDQHALALFDGMPASAGVSPQQVSAPVAAASREGAAAGARFGAPARAGAAMAMLSREDQARIAGIDQRSQRSFSMLQPQLDLAAQRNNDFIEGGQAMQIAGLGWNQQQMNRRPPGRSLSVNPGGAGWTDSRGSRPYVDPYTGQTVYPA